MKYFYAFMANAWFAMAIIHFVFQLPAGWVTAGLMSLALSCNALHDVLKR